MGSLIVERELCVLCIMSLWSVLAVLGSMVHSLQAVQHVDKITLFSVVPHHTYMCYVTLRKGNTLHSRVQ
jgi:hypothetical protein